ncbi:DUF1573 domain-containing protein [Ferruginibacter lapsinanis]|uniref:DUF1573 domain-containing protein n=1 Tax=Ferruginibacter lapsinanis TaxID=563172 RepID=UPI001E58AD83|nr:DUF1573 domain-containing protein [Ferruginibacter lapsinanis]UEG50217.1 DUF1573 domain-containing protein [Ferruginibacter lapsinanis]
MKKIVLSLALVSLSILTFAQTAKFATETIDLGKIKQGNPTKGTFVVTNIGTTPLIIEQANPTCGCTISDFTKSPIPVGKTGTIDATYNAANAGHFEKHLTVKFAGVDEVKSITLTGDVLSADDYAKWEAENAAKVKVAPVENKVVPAPAKKVTKTKKKTKKS